MPATADLIRAVTSVQNASRNSIPVAASTKIYQNAFVGLDTAGRARGLVAGDKFVGLAVQQADNSAGAAAAIDVETIVGLTVEMAVTGVTALTDVGAVVYAADDQTATLTATNNTAIGTVKRWITSTTCEVRIFTEAESALA